MTDLTFNATHAHTVRACREAAAALNTLDSRLAQLDEAFEDRLKALTQERDEALAKAKALEATCADTLNERNEARVKIDILESRLSTQTPNTLTVELDLCDEKGGSRKDRFQFPVEIQRGLGMLGQSTADRVLADIAGRLWRLARRPQPTDWKDRSDCGGCSAYDSGHCGCDGEDETRL